MPSCQYIYIYRSYVTTQNLKASWSSCCTCWKGFFLKEPYFLLCFHINPFFYIKSVLCVSIHSLITVQPHHTYYSHLCESVHLATRRGELVHTSTVAIFFSHCPQIQPSQTQLAVFFCPETGCGKCCEPDLRWSVFVFYICLDKEDCSTVG